MCRTSRCRWPPSRKAFFVAERPYTLLSCGMSIDGYLDSVSVKRLPLSNDADFDRVDAVRATCDAILVGAGTIRNDNPRLLVRSRTRRDERLARGLRPSPIKVTVTNRWAARRARRLLQRRRHGEGGLLRERVGRRRPRRGSGRWRPSLTRASRWICSGSARISTPAECSG